MAKKPAEAAVVDLAAETAAAELLVQQLRAMERIGNDFDDETIADTIEGETGLFEAIDRLIEVIHSDDAWIKGMKEQEKALKARRERYERRNEQRQWAIENALRLARRQKHQHPLCTVSFRAGRKNAKVEIFNEEDLPEEFYRKIDPEINKQLIAAELRAGNDVPGAKLVDGEDGYSWSSK